MLFPGETLVPLGAYPCLTWFRKGRQEFPLAVFLTGGGHLGRIAYGAPDCAEEDFLAHWLCGAGYSVLVPSHPIGHSVFQGRYPDLNVEKWTNAIAAHCRSVILENRLTPRLVVVAWSMAGRYATRLNRALEGIGISLEAFIAMAATPPVPGLAPVNLSETPIDASGLRTFTASHGRGKSGAVSARWQASIAEQNHREGHVIITQEAYERDFIGNNPLNLHGEELRWKAGKIVECRRDAEDDVMAQRFDAAPLAGAIVPSSASDIEHVLADRWLWSWFNARVIAARTATSLNLSTQGSAEIVPKLIELADGLSERLVRRIEGNHFFFVGSNGASGTAAAISELHTELKSLNSSLLRVSAAEFAVAQ